jgi:putative spermidine/putrescine transport system permease protein
VLWRRPWLKATGLLTPPVAAFLLVYVGALVVLFVSSLWTVDSFTGKLVHHWTLSNFRQIFDTGQPYLRIAGRTMGIAAAVTLTDAVLAFPLGYFMARIAGGRARAVLFVMVLLPLWASYLVRIYAWRTILAHDGAINWTLGGLGLPDQNIAYTNWAMWIVFSYVWLPFMVLPVYAALERIPDSYIEASADMGARGLRTLRSVSLTLGDFITPLLVGGPSSSFIGNVVYSFIGINANIPFAAAFAVIPVLIMGVYLTIARRLGAFEAL